MHQHSVFNVHAVSTFSRSARSACRHCGLDANKMSRTFYILQRQCSHKSGFAYTDRKARI